MENNKSQNIEDRVMSKIKSGKVKLRSKYIFIAEKLGLSSAFILSFSLAALFFNLFFYYLKTTDDLGYLSFGSDGMSAFLESFPYMLIVVLILFLFISGYLMAKADFSYKKPFGYFAVILIVFVMISGGVLAFTDISEQIEEQTLGENSQGSFFKPFLGHAVELRGSGLAGKVFEISDDYLIVEIPRGFQKVDIRNLENKENNEFNKDQFILAIGERRDDIFIARKIKIINEDDVPMIKRGIHRRPKLINPHFEQDGFIIQNVEIKKCMDSCLLINESRKACFDSCGAD